MATADQPSRSRQPLKNLTSTIDKLAKARPEQLRYGYLQRLRRLLRLRRDHYEELNLQGLRLLDRSIFAAYCDCVEIGEIESAKEVLKNVRFTILLSTQPRSDTGRQQISKASSHVETHLRSTERENPPEGYEY